MAQDDTVYVIDDDPAMRDSLEFLLDSAGFPVMLFESASVFLAQLPGLKLGCVVSDIRMPGINGMDMLRTLRERRPDLPVILMTGHGDIPLAVEAIKLGARDFLEKPFEDEQLVGAIRSALRQAKDSGRNDGAASDLAARVASLSPRERQVMDGLIAGLSNKLIARDHDISPRTIEVYRANVMTKMQAGSLSELVRLAMRSGMLSD